MLTCRISMTMRRFQYQYPRAYQRLLWILCIGLTGAGVFNSVGHAQHAHVGWGNKLAFDLPAAAEVAPQPAKVRITRLPGRDGSAAVPVQQPITPAATALAPQGGDMRGLGRVMSANMFGDDQWWALNNLWTRESNWNPNARNSSGACGIPQALPCSKIPDLSPQGQIAWGLGYIKARYGTPASAWAHSQKFGWY